MKARRGPLALAVVAILLNGALSARAMRPGSAVTVSGAVLAGSIVCHLHFAYNHTWTSSNDAETISSSGRLDVTSTYTLIDAGSPIYEHARLTDSGEYRDSTQQWQTDVHGTASGAFNGPSLHGDDFGENEISFSPGGPLNIGPFDAPMPVTGTRTSTYTSGSSHSTQTSRPQGTVPVYDASYLTSRVPALDHPVISATTTRLVGADTLEATGYSLPGLAPGTTVSGYNRCTWHLVLIVFNGRPVPQQPSPGPATAGTDTPAPTATRTPLQRHISSGPGTHTPTMTAAPRRTPTASPTV